MIVELTQHFLETGLMCPPGKRRVEYVSHERTGLYIEVRSTCPGVGTFYLRHKDRTGKTAHARLGSTADTTIEEARQKAKHLKAQITLGQYPGEDQPKEPASLTFADFFTEHYIPYAQPRKRTWQKDQEYFRVRLQDEFGHLPLGKITRQSIMAFHTRLKTEGLAGATCDHHVKVIRRVLNLAVEWGSLETNPAAKIPLFREDNRVEHYLSQEQLQRLLTVLRTDSNRTVCHICLFLISTGARLNEALRAEWKQIDKEKRVWRIPASNSKSKRVRSVPLNDSALDVLGQLETEEAFAYLFVNRRTGKPYVTIHKVWERLREEAGLPHLRIHDLRHQYASFLINSGRTLYEVQQILGHSDPSVTTRYAHLSTKSLQDAANTASEILTGASGRDG